MMSTLPRMTSNDAIHEISKTMRSLYAARIGSGLKYETVFRLSEKTLTVPSYCTGWPISIATKFRLPY